jgi:hypothetical protein
LREKAAVLIMVNPDRHLHKLDNIITLSQGCVYWKIAPFTRGISADVIWGKNTKKGKSKGNGGKRRKDKDHVILAYRGREKLYFLGGRGVTVFESIYGPLPSQHKNKPAVSLLVGLS